MGANKSITTCYLRSQGIELLGGRLRCVLWHQQLPFANGVHDFNPRDGTTRRPERFEPQHRSHHPLHGSMILLNGLITNDKFCFVRTSQVQLRWAHRPRRDSLQAMTVEKGYLPETQHLAGGTYEAPVANPPSLSDSHRRSTALGPSLSTPAAVGADVPSKQHAAACHAGLPRTGGRS